MKMITFTVMFALGIAVAGCGSPIGDSELHQSADEPNHMETDVIDATEEDYEPAAAAPKEPAVNYDPEDDVDGPTLGSDLDTSDKN